RFQLGALLGRELVAQLLRPRRRAADGGARSDFPGPGADIEAFARSLREQERRGDHGCKTASDANGGPRDCRLHVEYSVGAIHFPGNAAAPSSRENPLAPPVALRNAAAARRVPFHKPVRSSAKTEAPMASTKLSNYRAKRDFSRTSEPSGRLPVKPSSRLRFVVQKHAARRLHYDLRLELDGVFRSWAVTRGPSLDPADKRLAVEVEDHPLDYGDFEGVIPKGQYGGGSVQLWDRGYWRPLGDASPQEQLLKGELKFALQGERLRGAWVMVRMKGDRSGGKRTNWLLMKQRDVEARDQKAAQALLDEDRSIASGRSRQDIASGKGRRPKPFMLASRDLARADAVWSTNGGGEVATHARGRAAGNAQRTGASKRAASPNRAKAPPQFIEPQLCKLLERPPQNGGWGH